MTGKKRRNAKYELGMISTRGGKRTEQRRGVENTRAHAKVFVGPDKNANSSPDIRLLRRERAGQGEVVLLLLLGTYRTDRPAVLGRHHVSIINF